MPIELFSLPFLFPGYFCSVDACIVCIVSVGCNQSFFHAFLCHHLVFVSIHQCYVECWRFIFFLLFMTHSLSTSSLRCLSTSSLGCKALCIVIRFLVLWSICLSFSFVHFKNGPEYLTRAKPWYLSLWWDFCYIVWFLVLLLLFSLLRDIQTNFNWWLFTEVWMNASLKDSFPYLCRFKQFCYPHLLPLSPSLSLLSQSVFSARRNSVI